MSSHVPDQPQLGEVGLVPGSRHHRAQVVDHGGHPCQRGRVGVRMVPLGQYRDSDVLPKDEAKALEYLRRAAEGGWPPAQNDYGVIHGEGIWVEQDHAEAVKWFRMAAVGGHARAQHNLAVAHHNGRGVERDTTEALRWYLMAAGRGYARAQIAIGLMYLTGDGVEEDDYEAEEWFRMAAEEGDPLALRVVEMMEDYDPEEWGEE